MDTYLFLVLFTALSFLLGAIPFAVWVGRATTGEDIRDVGDLNPGATNVLRAGSRAGFILAMVLDISKAALPVGLAYQQWGIQDWRIVPIALAPVAGHAFSPFLRWNGGKALAPAFGVWIGLTSWSLSLAALGLLIFWRLIIRPPGWALLLTMICLGLLIAVLFSSPVFLAVCIGQAVILLFKQRTDLQGRPSLRLGQDT